LPANSRRNKGKRCSDLSKAGKKTALEMKNYQKCVFMAQARQKGTAADSSAVR
jgi:hypothetical protein